MMKDKTVLAGPVAAAIAASLCCLGPLVTVLLGLGTFGAAAMFEGFRPYLLGLTALLLTGAFYVTYRKREVVCQDGSCQVQGAARWNKIALWAVTALVAAIAAFPYYSSVFLASSTAASDGSSQPKAAISVDPGAFIDHHLRGHESAQPKAEISVQQSSPSPATNFSTVTFKVDGMTCAGCVANVKAALKQRNGVRSVDASLELKQATVKYDPARINPAQMIQAVNAIGFRASL
ncbi:MAG: cation transporter [Acidobacteria bacterium]|nr:cation transporter [Acidobacteriota bacterium]